MAEFPAMPFWTDAYLGDTKHLTTIEHGAYILLLITAWRSKSHTLPDSDKALSRYCGLTNWQWRRMRPTIEPFFTVENGKWISERLLREIEVVRRQVNQRSIAGQASALKRFKMEATTVQRTFNGRSTPTPTPIKKEEIGGKRGREESFFALPNSPEFLAWKAYAMDTNRKGLKDLLLQREMENRAFPFPDQWPPGHEAQP